MTAMSHFEMTRKSTNRRVWTPMPPPGMRPKLDRAQVRDLSILHNINLDAIARGEADEGVLWQSMTGALLWSQIAHKVGAGEAEMTAQLLLMEAVAARFKRTGKVGFSGPEYQQAKDGVVVQDQLAEIVDLHVAREAADWSEARINRMLATT